MSDIPESEVDHSLEDDHDQYTCIQIGPNWALMVHPEGDFGLRYQPDPKDPEGKEYTVDIGFTEYSANHINQILAVMRTGGESSVIH
ncbi:hypothetical protein PP747_gp033 [Rhizobium phage RHph_Y38]|uniref:Uncharacterized protein n=2 Tax=Acanvirus TaxID=3044653 RepID=A0A7S5USM2_9CAUD|nr:hypothetical protein PP747_gp033 [Rhizobium phage RHph_Y38]YP_010658244.1 hypothetical protein PP749_gp033 [Rhizobium phage RHEph22]QIG67734.1 hypothetical protein EVB52_033 [Rhizobium phage RHph_Y38]QXV74706.1 hypothetical protein [Rhizobium phage RHEph22]QXV74800.1 hypothetical protein [Rhizobium phage RHEph24]